MDKQSDVSVPTGMQHWYLPPIVRIAHVSQLICFPTGARLGFGTTQTFSDVTSSVNDLTIITIPASVEILSESCFYECKSLSRVTFAAGSCLKRIEKWVFYKCESLKEIEIPASVEVLSESCFAWCMSLSRVTFAAGSCLKRIEKEAFYKCESLKEIEIPAGVEVLCEVALQVCKD